MPASPCKPPQAFKGARGKRNTMVKCNSATYWNFKLPLIIISSYFPGCWGHCSKQATLINRVLIILLSWFKHITSALAIHWFWMESEFWATIRLKYEGTLYTSVFLFSHPSTGQRLRQLLFIVKVWWNRNSASLHKIPKPRTCSLKGLHSCLTVTCTFLVLFWPGFLLFGWRLLRAVTWHLTCCFPFSLPELTAGKHLLFRTGTYNSNCPN